MERPASPIESTSHAQTTPTRLYPSSSRHPLFDLLIMVAVSFFLKITSTKIWSGRRSLEATEGASRSRASISKQDETSAVTTQP